MQISRIIPLILLIIFTSKLESQNTLISDDPAANIEATAVLNIHSDTKGLLIPRLTKTARNSIQSPATGLIVFETGSNKLYYYNGISWVQVQYGTAPFYYSSSKKLINNISYLSSDFLLGEIQVPGNSPVTNELLFYDKSKSAFRVGSLFNSDAWSPDSIGTNSIGMGTNAKATGTNSVSLGFENTSRGDYSTAMGYYSFAKGDYSTAMGYFAQAVGTFSQANGLATESTGQISTTFGNGTKANAKASMAIGQYNVGGGNPDTWVKTDPLFEIGNGSANNAPKNALTVLKNGDFIVGSHELPISQNTTDTLLFYDRSKVAFRGGSILNFNGWINDSIGQNSFAYGHNTKASKSHTIALGYRATAFGQYSISLGHSNVSFGTKSIAMGNGAASLGEESMAFGDSPKSNGIKSISIGSYSEANGNFSTAMGEKTKADSRNGFALGKYNVGGGNPTFWIPTDPLFEIGNGENSLNTRNALTVSKNGDFIVGGHKLPTSGSSSDTIMFFDQSKAAFRGGFIDNDDWVSDSIGNFSFAFGENGIAKGDNSISLGNNNIASGQNSFAAGFSTKALGTNSFSASSYTLASGNNSFAAGLSTEATGSNSFSVGSYNLASGKNSLAAGASTNAIGDNSSSFGSETTANGKNSTAMGSFSTTVGENSTAMGFYTDATGENSTSIGYFTEANGENSISMGYDTEANGKNSNSVGLFTFANGDNSSAFGVSTYANSYAATTIGAHNLTTPGNLTTWIGTDQLFTIGNGNPGNRSNALTILKNGKIGVNTHTPEGMMHIKHNSSSSNPHLILEEDGTETDFTRLKLLNSTQSEYWNLAGRPDDDSEASARFNIFYSDKGNILSAFGNGNIRLAFGALMFGTITSPGYRIHLPNTAIPVEGQAIAYAWKTYSDARVKSNVQTITYGLKEILALNPVSYLHHSSEFNEGKLVVSQDEKAKNVGFIAQEVYEVIQEVVSKPENEDTELWSMDYEKLTPVLVKAIQEQQKQIDLLEERLDEAIKLLIKLDK